jgi:pimeloyl-ACP methyl ester carboxylesterase
LILYGGFAQGAAKRARNVAERERLAAVQTLVRLGWGQENPAFRQIFTSEFVPEGTKEQINWWNEMQRVSATPENAERFIAVVSDIDVTDLLAKVTVPTLVLHARDDARVPFDAGRRMAAGIPGARLVSLQSRNHLILENEPAYVRFLEEIRSFMRA